LNTCSYSSIHQSFFEIRLIEKQQAMHFCIKTCKNSKMFFEIAANQIEMNS